VQGNNASHHPFISPDGRFVSFDSGASNLVTNDTNMVWDVFIYHRQINMNTRVSISSSGQRGASNSMFPSVSNDGRITAFQSDANNLVSDDTNGRGDMFVHKNKIVTGPFLDLPFQYTDFLKAAKGNNNGGYVNSWFDHETPHYQKDGYLLPWLGNSLSDPPNLQCALGSNCYDGHNGIDYQRNKGDLLYAAAPGTVVDLCNSYPCPRPPGVITSDSSYGKWVLIQLSSNYATFYAHLDSIDSQITIGLEITDARAAPMGTVGGTSGHPPHLHFGVYFDDNGNGQWEDVYQGYTEAIDPYGYQGNDYLWLYPLSIQKLVTPSGYLSSHIFRTSPQNRRSAIIPLIELSSLI
jgi:murein DD-endopeptidase MepM/ murein hydrolase activator NlpD